MPKQEDHFLHSKLSQRDIAGILQIDTKTLYNWKKHKPNLYCIVMLGFRFNEMLISSKKYYEELLAIESNIKESPLLRDEIIRHLHKTNL
ncbi:transcriptional regulator [Helicobacter sp.]|uniref:transcriptional regulator n=1 Tax=Helicobacter sp. TaxID=218 RepID=UPI0019A2FC46|nr:transcriptional regulator [Helicobacter sp.]MBD5164439.1 transcriptional regulator [Helicobacter sp.]